MHENAEIREPAGITKPLPYAVGAGRVELRRIAGAFALWHAPTSIFGMTVLPTIGEPARRIGDVSRLDDVVLHQLSVRADDSPDALS